jgi:uncharacterized protein
MSEENSSTLVTLQKFFEDQSDVNLAILFGSLANGRATPRSDADIAIQSAVPLNLDRRVKLRAQLFAILKRKIDLLDISTLHGVILHQVLQGQVIKSNHPHLLAKQYTRYLIEDADFGPLRRMILKKRREDYFGSHS